MKEKEEKQEIILICLRLTAVEPKKATIRPKLFL